MRNWRWLLLSVAIIVLDQGTKILAVRTIQPHERVPVIAGFFDWTLTFNTGVAFSMFSQGPQWQKYGLSTLALAVVAVLVVWLGRLRADEKLSALAIAMIVGGALGNVIDRMRLGHVVDFILWYWRDWHWPAFNIADSAISVGVVILLIAGFRQQKA